MLFFWPPSISCSCTSRIKSVLVISSVWFQLPQLSSIRNDVSIIVSVLAVSLLRAQHSSFYSYCILQFQPAPSTSPINCFPFCFISSFEAATMKEMARLAELKAEEVMLKKRQV